MRRERIKNSTKLRTKDYVTFGKKRFIITCEYYKYTSDIHTYKCPTSLMYFYTDQLKTPYTESENLSEFYLVLSNFRKCTEDD